LALKLLLLQGRGGAALTPDAVGHEPATAKEAIMKITIWGARGSIPAPGQDTALFGGNTSCLNITNGQGDIIIFDAGTGIRLLGNALMAQLPLTAHLFFSHVHWDHIQGFPFFSPLYIRGNRICLYGEHKFKTSLEDTLAGQMQYPTFPVLLEDVAAHIEFTHLKEYTAVQINDTVVSCIKGNHPNGVFVYKVEEGDKTIVYATDNEHSSCINPRLKEFIHGADLLIYDTQYTDEEYSGKRGACRISWGHSTIEEGVKLAQAAEVKALLMWHHDPSHTDSTIAAMETWAQGHFPQTTAAREGMILTL